MSYYLKNTIEMNETAVWSDMIFNTTVEKWGAHTVNLKTTGHEIWKSDNLSSRSRRWQQE